MRATLVCAGVVILSVLGCSGGEHEDETRTEQDRQAYLQRRLEALDAELEALQQRLPEVPTEKQRREILDRLQVLRAQYDELLIQLPEAARPPARKQLQEICPEDDPLCNAAP